MSNGFRISLAPPPDAAYQVIGTEMQVVNVLLKPSQSVEVSPGAMMHHGPSIYAEPRCTCSCGRYCTGESNILINYVNKGSEPEVIGLTPNYPAKIIPIHLSEGGVIVRTTSYMCGVGDVNIGINCDFCSLTCCFGDMGPIRQKITGSGIAFLQAGGTVLEKTLTEGETICIDEESLIGWSETVKFTMRQFGGFGSCCSICFGGEGCCLAALHGPGKIYITSMNFKKWHNVLAPSYVASRSNPDDPADTE